MNSLKISDLKTCKKEYFEKAWQLYEDSFPSEEKRTLIEQKKILQNKKYNAKVFIKDKEVLSILFFWNFKDYIFIEHFAVNSIFRGQAFGSKILIDFLKEKDKVFLEIELLKDEISKKRYEFYKKNDFIINEFKHYQVPFRSEDKNNLELLLLSYKKQLEKEEYNELYLEMEKSITL